MNLRPHLGDTMCIPKPRSVSGRRAVTPAVLAAAAAWALVPRCIADDDVAPDQPARTLAEKMEWVRIGDANNRSDGEGGLGHVAADFMLGKFEVTNAQFCEFLNATACGQNNLHGIAFRNADGQPIGPATNDIQNARGQQAIGITVTVQLAGDFRYASAGVMGPKPVVNLRWCDAARLANWLHNGAMPGAETDSGAYNLDPEKFSDTYAVPLQPGARFWIPSLDEWYKAAYYDPFSNGGTYHDFPTDSGDAPKPVAAMAPNGIGAPSRNDIDYANFMESALWWQPPAKPGKSRKLLCNVTSVGTNGQENVSNACDMAGNAAELVTAPGAAPGEFLPLACGGDYRSRALDLKRDTLQRPALRGKLPVTGGLRLARMATADDPPQILQRGPGAMPMQLLPLFQIGLPERKAGEATPAKFNELKKHLQRRRDKFKGNGQAPAPVEQLYDDAIKALEEAEKLAIERDQDEQAIGIDAKILNKAGVPVNPAADEFLRRLNADYEAKLRGPYEKFDRVRNQAKNTPWPAPPPAKKKG